MFDLAWSELALIGVVALVVIGPKDLPNAVRGLARGIQKLRRMASEFQQHADELVKEANLQEVRQQISEIRNFNFRDEIERAVDSDGTIRKTFTEDPLRTDYGPTPASATPVSTTEPEPQAPFAGIPPTAMEDASSGSAKAKPTAPAFIPPSEASIAPPAHEAPRVEAAPLPESPPVQKT
ncbi:MAG: Sec-independent protein translocase protein TatB [Acetobacteraceae bacterium]|nr:Sec-independent protein translocase protein TatB [Acetobacteraceae bacterium]